MSDLRTSDPIPGNEILDGFLDRLRCLGFEAHVSLDPVTGQSVTSVSAGDRDLCRIEFSAFAGRYTLNVMPVDRDEITLIAQAVGRVCEPEPVYLEDALDHVEALFRAAAVREGMLPEPEFPTDYDLRRWVARASSVRLPHERGARARQTQDVLIRHGELPDDRAQSTTPTSRALVQAIRLLDVGFERARAIELARAAAAVAIERDRAGAPVDGALAYLANTARVAVRGRRVDMDLAWDKGGYERVLALHGRHRDDMRVPLALTEEAPAPRLW